MTKSKTPNENALVRRFYYRSLKRKETFLPLLENFGYLLQCYNKIIYICEIFYNKSIFSEIIILISYKLFYYLGVTFVTMAR